MNLFISKNRKLSIIRNHKNVKLDIEFKAGILMQVAFASFSTLPLIRKSSFTFVY